MIWAQAESSASDERRENTEGWCCLNSCEIKTYCCEIKEQKGRKEKDKDTERREGEKPLKTWKREKHGRIKAESPNQSRNIKMFLWSGWNCAVRIMSQTNQETRSLTTEDESECPPSCTRENTKTLNTVQLSQSHKITSKKPTVVSDSPVQQ